MQAITFRAPTGTITASVNPITPQVDEAATVTVTGASEMAASVFAKIRPGGGVGCAPTFSADSGDGLIFGKGVDGAFSLPVTTTPPGRIFAKTEAAISLAPVTVTVAASSDLGGDRIPRSP